MARNTSFKGQAYAAQNLAITPDPNRYEVAEYSVEELYGRTLMIARVLQHKLYASQGRRQLFTVGQKGGVKTVYDTLIY